MKIPETLRVASSNSEWFASIYDTQYGVKIGTPRGTSKYIDICWPYDGKHWSFATDIQGFMNWMNHGLSVACIECWYEQVKENTTCPHVEFSDEHVIGRAKAMAKIVRMGLL